MASPRSTRVSAAQTLIKQSVFLPVHIIINLLLAPILLARWKAQHATAGSPQRLQSLP